MGEREVIVSKTGPPRANEIASVFTVCENLMRATSYEGQKKLDNKNGESLNV